MRSELSSDYIESLGSFVIRVIYLSPNNADESSLFEQI